MEPERCFPAFVRLFPDRGNPFGEAPEAIG